MRGKRDYILIPIALMVYAYKKKVGNSFRTFIYLKTICSGHFKISSEFIIYHSAILKVNPRTFRNHLSKLVGLGWITINRKTNSFRLIGFVQLARKLKLQSAKGALFYFTEIDSFKEFCLAAIAKYYIHWVRRRRKRSELNIASSRKYRERFSYPFLPIRYLAKVLLISPSTVIEQMRLSEKAGYMSITHQYQETTIPSTQFSMLKQYGALNPDSIRKSWNRIVLQKPNKLEVDVILRRKDNLRKVCSQNWKEKN